MKRFTIIFLILFAILNDLYAEDYIASSKSKTEFTDTTTNDRYIINNVPYNIFKSRTGAFYIWKTSKKTNKKYKYYLPKKLQIKMGRIYKEDN